MDPDLDEPWTKAFCLSRLHYVVQLVKRAVRGCVELTWEKIKTLVLTPPPVPLEILAFTDESGYRTRNVAVDNLWLIPLKMNLTERSISTISFPDVSGIELRSGLSDYGLDYRACSLDLDRDVELNLAVVPLFLYV